jgi:hypothetical protein
MLKIDLLLIISVYVQVILVIIDARGELFLIAVLVGVWDALLGQGKVYLVAFLFLQGLVVRLGREISDLGLAVRGVYRLDHNVECEPDVSVVTLLEGVEFAVIGAAICVNLRVLVAIQDATHCPLAIHEPAISHLQVHTGRAARAAQVEHLFLDGENAEAFIDDHELLESGAFRIVTVAEPGQTICDLTVPGRILLPVHFLNVLNRVESKVDAEGDLKTLRLVSIVHAGRIWEGRTYEGGVLPTQVCGI